MSQPSKQPEPSHNDKSATILKSGYLWKKGTGILGHVYKERLFELKLTGKLDYYEIVIGGKKVFKGTIVLSSSSKIKIRNDCPSDQHKLIIKTKQREWYLWCKAKNGKQQIQEWCSLINDMINSSKSTETTQKPQQPTVPIIHDNKDNNNNNNNNNDIDTNQEDGGSSDELFGDYPTPNDIIITRPANPNQPFNPFYGGSISAASITTTDNDINHQQPQQIQHNPYYAPLKPLNNNNVNNINNINNNNIDNDSMKNASAPIFEEKTDSVLTEEFKSMDLQTLNRGDIQFKIGPTVSLKSVLFKSWISYNDSNRYLCAVTTAPMVNERFTFQCVDEQNKIYTIQTPNGLYLSADINGQLKYRKKLYGINEQWIIRYHHINKISITSKYYHTHFGIDANGLFHHKYPSLTDIVKFEVSPPVNLTQNERNKAIHVHHWQQTHSLPPSANKDILWPKLQSGSMIALSGCIGDCNFIGVENKSSKSLRTDYTTCTSFDGELLTRSTFYILQNKPYQLFAFKSALNDKYISPSDTITGRIKFVDELTEKEYFSILWHDINIISLVTFHGTIFKIKQNKNDNTLWHEGYDWRSPHCSFQIKSKQFDKINNKSTILRIPRPQLPVRSINGKIKRDIWLKGHCGDNMGYLAFRSKPYRYEAVSRIMGRWETIRFQHDIKRNNSDSKCIVSLYTENGMIFACDAAAKLVFLTKDDENDELRCRWNIYFHDYSLISIQNERYKGWMVLKKHIKTNFYLLTMINPNFDHNGNPIIDIENARKFKNIYCQFELCPIANCKDIKQQQSNIYNANNGYYNNMNKNKTGNSSVSFAM